MICQTKRRSPRKGFDLFCLMKTIKKRRFLTIEKQNSSTRAWFAKKKKQNELVKFGFSKLNVVTGCLFNIYPSFFQF